MTTTPEALGAMYDAAEERVADLVLEWSAVRRRPLRRATACRQPTRAALVRQRQRLLISRRSLLVSNALDHWSFVIHIFELARYVEPRAVILEAERKARTGDREARAWLKDIDREAMADCHPGLVTDLSAIARLFVLPEDQ